MPYFSHKYKLCYINKVKVMTTLYNQFFLIFTHVDLKVAILKDLIQTKLCNNYPFGAHYGGNKAQKENY